MIAGMRQNGLRQERMHDACQCDVMLVGKFQPGTAVRCAVRSSTSVGNGRGQGTAVSQLRFSSHHQRHCLRLIRFAIAITVLGSHIATIDDTASSAIVHRYDGSRPRQIVGGIDFAVEFSDAGCDFGNARPCADVAFAAFSHPFEFIGLLL